MLVHPRTTLFVTVATVGLTVVLAAAVPKGFFPQQDTGMILGVTHAAPDTSFSKKVELQRAMADELLADADVQSVASFIGCDGTNPTTNSGRLSITFTPRDQHVGVAAIMARLTPKVASVAGIEVNFNLCRIWASTVASAARSTSTRTNRPIPVP